MVFFKYEELDPALDNTRVLTVQKSRADDGCLSCLLETVSLHEIGDNYYAVSHPWSKEHPTFKISLNGGTFCVTPQLWKLLHLASERLPSQRLWIDAICINQHNVAEKQKQIPLMGQIYSNTQKLIAWLPSSTDGYHSSDSEHDPSLRAAKSLSEADIDTVTEWTKTDTPAHLEPVLMAFYRLMTHQYWTRVWIVQELRLSKQREFWWEGQIFSSSHLEFILHTIETALAENEVKQEAVSGGSTAMLASDKDPPMLLHHMSREAGGHNATFTDSSALVDLAQIVSQYAQFGCTLVHDRVFAFLGLASGCDKMTVDYDTSPIDLLATAYHMSKNVSRQTLYTIGRALAINWQTDTLIDFDVKCCHAMFDEMLRSLLVVGPSDIQKRVTNILSKTKTWDEVKNTMRLGSRTARWFNHQPGVGVWKSMGRSLTGNMSSYKALLGIIEEMLEVDHIIFWIYAPTLGMAYKIGLTHMAPAKRPACVLEVLKIETNKANDELGTEVYDTKHAVFRHRFANGQVGGADEHLRHKSVNGYGGRWLEGNVEPTEVPGKHRLQSTEDFFTLLEMSREEHSTWTGKVEHQHWSIPMQKS